MRLRRMLALLGAMTATVFAACKEPPFAPRWDADMYMPLSTQSIHLDQAFSPLPAIPGDSSRSVGFQLTQDISGVIGDVLKNLVTDPARCSSTVNLSCDLLTLKITKTTAVSATDTLFVANALTNLNAAAAGTVVFPIALAVSDNTKTDSLYLTQTSVQMLQNAGQGGTPLYILLRGPVTNPSASPVALTSADSLGISLSVTARIAVSHK